MFQAMQETGFSKVSGQFFPHTTIAFCLLGNKLPNYAQVMHPTA